MNWSRRPDKARSFDWFVLSDTTDPAIWIAEEKCFLQAATGLGGAARSSIATARKTPRASPAISRTGSSGSAPIMSTCDLWTPTV